MIVVEDGISALITIHIVADSPASTRPFIRIVALERLEKGLVIVQLQTQRIKDLRIFADC